MLSGKSRGENRERSSKRLTFIQPERLCSHRFPQHGATVRKQARPALFPSVWNIFKKMRPLFSFTDGEQSINTTFSQLDDCNSIDTSLNQSASKTFAFSSQTSEQSRPCSDLLPLTSCKILNQLQDPADYIQGTQQSHTR